MSTYEALDAALERFDAQEEPWTYVPLLVAAARERLAQLPEKCDNCDGSGIVVPHTIHEAPCPACSGTGKVYPAELVERIASLIHQWDDRRNSRASAVAVLDALNETP